MFEFLTPKTRFKLSGLFFIKCIQRNILLSVLPAYKGLILFKQQLNLSLPEQATDERRFDKLEFG